MGNVYKVIELVGTSSESWEKAAAAAVEKAGESLRDLRVAEVVELDMQIEDSKVKAYRAKVKVSQLDREVEKGAAPNVSLELTRISRVGIEEVGALGWSSE